MYKLTKGIKKKVKGKKKPTQEELEQEELRQYRLEKQQEQELREQEQRQKEEKEPGDEGVEDQTEEGAVGATSGDSENTQQKPAESDEWAKFRALTSGVDSVLSSTKESLQTIKETSYFIRKKPTVEQKAKTEDKPTTANVVKPKWVDVDVEEESPESEPESAEAPAEESPKTPSPEKKRDLEEVLSEVEKLERAQYFEEDVFNTEYVDAVKDINLAVIPDSPTDDGDDPFDTSAVDEVLREKPEEIRKKKLKSIALGNAVKVLSGTQKDTEKSEEQQELCLEVVPKKSRRRERGVYRRKGSLDLLETAENVNSQGIRVTKSATVSPTEETPAKKTLLDEEIEDGGNFELNLAVTPDFCQPQSLPETTENKGSSSPESHNKVSDIVSEFDTKPEPPKVGSNEAILTAEPPDENDLEFDSLATESLLRAKDREEIIGDDDPFDTSVVTQVLGDKATADVPDVDEEEVKFHADFGETKSRPVRPPPPVIITSPEKEAPDFLTSNEHHDYEPLPEPIQFSVEQKKKQDSPVETEQEEVDPFDTSAADKLVGTEIKFLEKELLASSDVPVTAQAQKEDDFDFDPRAGEEKPEPDPFDTSFAGGFASEPTVNAAELLASTPPKDSTPVFLPPQQVTDSTPQAEIDPFDTSIADTFGNVELKVLESELLTTPELVTTTDIAKKLDLSVTSAPPRPPLPAPKAETSSPASCDETKPQEPKPAPPLELLTLTPEEEHTAPVALVPQRLVEDVTAEELDPFDTSIADNFGTVEVGVLEQELLGASPAPAAKQLTDLLPSLADELRSENKTVLKTENGRQEEEDPEEKERDVFDTSFAEVAETVDSSVVDGARFTKPCSLSVSESSAALLVSTPEDPNPLLQPVSATGAQSDAEEIDPFDTSAAEQFGHTELRVLESELLGEVRCSQKPPARPAPPRPVLPRPTPPAAPLPVPSADELLAVTPSAEELPTLQPHSDAPTPRPLSPVVLDPFDTSIADRYGTTELRVLEQEFAGDGATSPALKRAVSDPDFDPRGEEKVARPATPPAAAAPVGCLLDSDTGASAAVQTLTATVVSTPVAAEPEDVDPFDTSIADSLVPGKGEILALERELLNS